MSDKVLYVISMNHCVKIGVTNNPERRVRQLRNGGTGARIVRLWNHEHPMSIELMCRDAWHMRREHCFETFEASPRAAVMLVNKMIRAFDCGERPGTKKQRMVANKKRRAARIAAGRETLNVRDLANP